LLSEKVKKQIIIAQKNEITEHLIYKKLASVTIEAHNRDILNRISSDELRHHNLWRQYTGYQAKPNMFIVWIYYLIARILGLTFGIKLMENGEERAQVSYDELAQQLPVAGEIAREENDHENALIALIDEERLNYIGSVIRGLNDALIELTGALAGFTFALQKPQLVAMTGLITGIAAALSMGSTEYLASKSEKTAKKPLKSALYTGSAYILTVMFLVFPYLIFSNVYLSMGIMLLDAIIVILVFNFYYSVAKDEPFGRRFGEMALLSLGIAAISFGIGILVRYWLGVEV
jgi:VIT1/CCC1 family predicted Fe2+/Mn2+ transporter